MCKISILSTRRLKLHQLRLTIIIFIPIIVTILFYIYDGMTIPRAEIKIKLVSLETYGTSTLGTTQHQGYRDRQAQHKGRTALKQIIPIKSVISLERTRKQYETSMSNHVQALKLGLLNEQKELISYELEGYNFTVNGKSHETASIPNLEKYVKEKGGNPIRNVIFATWRSGSTFLGDLVNSHPATFYHYEPLLHLGVKQVRSTEDENESLKVITQLLSCNYTNIEEFNNWQYKSQERNLHNKRLWRFCQKSNHRKICADPAFVSGMCKLFPFQIMKTVRLRLNLGKVLLENKGVLPDLDRGNSRYSLISSIVRMKQ